jgi:hypothetical protein
VYNAGMEHSRAILEARRLRAEARALQLRVAIAHDAVCEAEFRSRELIYGRMQIIAAAQEKRARSIV